MKIANNYGIWEWDDVCGEHYWDFGKRPYFYPEEEIRFTLEELKAIVVEMEKMNAVRPK